MARFDYRRELKELSTDQLKGRISRLKDDIIASVGFNYDAQARYQNYLQFAQNELEKRNKSVAKQ